MRLIPTLQSTICQALADLAVLAVQVVNRVSQ